MNLRRSILGQSLLLIGALASVMSLSSVSEGGSKNSNDRKPVITKPKFDPAAARVEFFKGMEEGQIESRFVPKDASGGFILVTNTTAEPVTVELPEAFVAVQVLKQFGGGGMSKPAGEAGSYQKSDSGAPAGKPEKADEGFDTIEYPTDDNNLEDIPF